MSENPMKLKELAALGAKYEQKLNTLIEEQLNDDRLVTSANRGIERHVKALRWLRQFNKFIAQQLNLPTKDDVAAVSKLVMQLEEKLDQIENLLLDSSSSRPQMVNPIGPIPASISQEQEDQNVSDENEESSEPETKTSFGRSFLNLITTLFANEFLNALNESLENTIVRRGGRRG